MYLRRMSIHTVTGKASHVYRPVAGLGLGLVIVDGG